MYFQGIERNTLEIFIPGSSKTFDEIDRLFQPANLQAITIIDDNGQYQYSDYILRVSLSLKPVMFQADTEVKTENQFVIMIAQQDKLYSKLKEMRDTIDMQNEILADMLGGAYS